MKLILKTILLILLISGTGRTYAQTVQLVPDSCTFCLFLTSTGGTGWYQSGYGISPNEDTLVLGNNYTPVHSGFDSRQPFAIRQVGNKLFGVVADSVSEYLLMDFDADITDTIHDLYSEGFFYDAVVIGKDSMLVNNGIYHHFMELNGIGVYTSSGFIPDNWIFVWNERGLCASNGWDGWDLGGVLYNIPINFYSISAVYAFPEFCTTDPVYTNPSNVSCADCIAQTNGIEELSPIEINLFPNPAADVVTVQSNEIIERIVMYTACGLKVMEQPVEGKEMIVRVSELPAGFYFLNVNTGKGLVVSQLIKM